MKHADHVALLRAGVPQPGGVWADFGAGAGSFSLALAELIGPRAELWAVDRDAGALRQLARSMAASFPSVSVHQLAADFTQPLPARLPPLDGLVMANALHFVPRARQLGVVGLLRGCLRPGGRLLLVEYNVDQGNLWVPHPLSFESWQALAGQAGFAQTRLLATAPSSFLREFYAAESVTAD